ncbi:MAG: rod shape-determining protein [Clostridia bacterium]|nr:rod shape-determining protein [Clostridia bacterium]
MIGTSICFDPGTSNMTLWVDGKGIVTSEPSVIAYDAQTGKISAIGKKAYEMTGRNSDWIDVVRPIKDGKFFDLQTAQRVLSYYIQKLCGNKVLKPNVLMSIPCSANTVDKRTVIDIATSSGAAKACAVEETLAAAVGAGIDVDDYKGTVIVDIGGGITDISVIAKGLVCVSSSVKVAGNTFDDAIISYAKKEKELIIGKITAEKIKKEIGCTSFLEAELAMRTVGKDILTGLPKETEITSADVFMSIRELLESIAEEIRLLLEKTPPELSGDIHENGIIITGGSAKLKGIDRFLEYRTGVPAKIADDPETCVIRGLAKLSKAPKLLEKNACFYKTRQELGYDEY